jgi:putative transposase
MVTAEPSTGRFSLTEKQRSILQRVVLRTHCPKIVSLRAGLVLAADEGLEPTAAGKRLHCSRKLAARWRDRFAVAQAGLAQLVTSNAVVDKGAATVENSVEADAKAEAKAAAEAEARLTRQILDALGDRPRSGAPRKFEPTQLCQIMSIACEKRPEECGRPVTHWTARELADEAVKRGIVPSISQRHVGRFLKERPFALIGSGIGSTAPISGKTPRNSSAEPARYATYMPQRRSCTSRACMS